MKEDCNQRSLIFFVSTSCSCQRTRFTCPGYISAIAYADTMSTGTNSINLNPHRVTESVSINVTCQTNALQNLYFFHLRQCMSVLLSVFLFFRLSLLLLLSLLCFLSFQEMLQMIRTNTALPFLRHFPRFFPMYTEISTKFHRMFTNMQQALTDTLLKSQGNFKIFNPMVQSLPYHFLVFQITRYQEYIDLVESMALSDLSVVIDVYNKDNTS